MFFVTLYTMLSYVLFMLCYVITCHVMLCYITCSVMFMSCYICYITCNVMLRYITYYVLFLLCYVNVTIPLVRYACKRHASK